MKILVVCTANIARSPVAAAMLAATLGSEGIEVESAGTHALPGNPAADASQEQAELRGLDLREHRSRPVTYDLVHRADLLLTMSEHHRDLCAPNETDLARRAFTLREFVRLLDDIDVSDAPPGAGERLAWATQRADRSRRSSSPADPTLPEDVHDPIRGPASAWTAMGLTLDELCGRVVEVAGRPLGWDRPTPPDEEPGRDDEPDGSWGWPPQWLMSFRR